MSSNSFLQRFKGKTNTISKEGIHQVVGSKHEKAIGHSNPNSTSYKPNSSTNKIQPQLQIPRNHSRDKKPLTSSHQNNAIKTNSIISSQNQHPPNKQKKNQNPFFVSNPFYLDEQDRQKQEKQKKEKVLFEKMEKEKERELLKNNDPKKITQGSISKSLDKKKNDKEWIKLGGLGANIGGEQWLEKKKKLEKMQEFAEQVKSINSEKPKIPKAERREEKKELNPRLKALEYSKNIPKPVIRQAEKELVEEEREEVREQLSELQLYEQRHEQLKNMLKNQ